MKRAPGEQVRRLCTEEQAQAIEEQWSEHQRSGEIARELATLRLTAADFDREAARLGSGYSPGDVLWSLRVETVIQAAARGDWHTSKIAYYGQALQLAKEGKDPTPPLRSALRAAVEEIRATGLVQHVQISTAGSQSCAPCQSLDGRVFSIEEALRQMPLPCPQCEKALFTDRGFCRCTYNPHSPEWE